MRIAIIGSKNLSCSLLDICLEQGHEVLAVYSRDDEQGMQTWLNQLGHRSLKQLATSKNIPVYEGKKINSLEVRKNLESLDLDVIFSCFWSEILREDVLVIPKLGVFNIHTALLPKNRGSRPIPWAIINGEEKTGITLHKMMTGVDNGPIVDSESVYLNSSSTAKSVYNDLMAAGSKMFERALPTFKNNSFQLHAQIEEDATYQPPGEPYGGKINPFWSDDQKDRFERAFRFPPFGGAKPFFNELSISESKIQLLEIDPTDCLEFDEFEFLSRIKVKSKTSIKRYFNYYLKSLERSNTIFLTKPFSKTFTDSYAHFSLGNYGFQCVAEIQDVGLLKEKDDWELQPHFMKNGMLKVPVFELKTKTEALDLKTHLDGLREEYKTPVIIPLLKGGSLDLYKQQEKGSNIKLLDWQFIFDLYL